MTNVTSKQTNTPILRFPDFDDAWVSKPLKVLAEITTGSRDTQNRVENGAYPFFVRSNNVERIDSYGYDGEAVLTSGDGVGVGKNFHYINGKFDFHQRVYAIHKFCDELDGKFFYHYFSENFLRRVMRLSAKNSVDSVRMSMIADMAIPHPSKIEQQKIAAFLGAVDEKISLLTRTKTLLEDYKRGCMRRLFTQVIRFKDDDGRDFPDWEEVKLSSVAKIFDGTHQTPTYTEDGVPFYSVEHLTSNDFSSTKYISEEVFAAESKRVSIERGDILLTRIGDIGTSREVDWDVRASFYVSLALIKLNGEVRPSFASQFMKSDFFQRELWHRTIHVAFPKKINLGEIGQCAFKVPHPREQEKIGTFLAQFDSKIRIAEREITEAKALKKGLHQKLFV